MRVARLASAVLPPLVWGVAFVAAWEALVRGFDLKPYFLPAPTAIWSAFTDNLGLVRAAAFVSGGNALVGGGNLVSCALGGGGGLSGSSALVCVYDVCMMRV
ncbi:MAG: hypothetical protein ACPGSH_03470 [Ilumatobacteraceae bacterium]